MKFIKIIFFLYLVFSFGCSSDDSVDVDCIDATLKSLEMVPYTGQDISCEMFLELYHFENKQYFLLGNHCADMITYPTDCDGNQLCVTDEDRQCRKFYDKADRIGVVGIRIN